MKQRLLLNLLAIAPLLAQHTDQFWPRQRHLQFGPPFSWPQTTATTAPGTEVRRDQVLQLVKELFDNDVVPIYDIEQFRFVPLEKGKVHLVVVADSTDRAFFNDIFAIECSGTTCNVDSAHSDEPNNLDDQLIDPEKDGVFKILTKHRVLGYQGARTKPIYTYYIFRLKTCTKWSPLTERAVTGPDLCDVTADYGDYYTSTVLPRIEQTEKAVEEEYSRASDGDRAEVHAALEFVDDDYQRRILHVPRAGLENALSWIDSQDRVIWSLGIEALESIDDGSAEAKLKELTASVDKDKAGAAEGALARRREKAVGLSR